MAGKIHTNSHLKNLELTLGETHQLSYQKMSRFENLVDYRYAGSGNLCLNKASKFHATTLEFYFFLPMFYICISFSIDVTHFE